jgi:hypothetical protein
MQSKQRYGVAEWGSRSKQLFLTLKRQGHLMNQEQIETLVAFWLERELDEAEDYRAICGTVSEAHRWICYGIGLNG